MGLDVCTRVKWRKSIIEIRLREQLSTPKSTAHARVTMTTEECYNQESSKTTTPFCSLLPVILEGHAWASIEEE